jgi:polar amino acid transport system substrate-binding protein
MLRMRIVAAVAVAVLTGAGVVATRPVAAQAQAPTPSVKDALAPTGKLRVGLYLGSPTSMTVRSGQETHGLAHDLGQETHGLAHDLGQELAKRLGVPFEPVMFPHVAAIIKAMKAAAVDFTVTNATDARAELVDFSPMLLSLELGYLVPAGSAIVSAADIDKAGNRIGVTEGSTSARTLPKLLPKASIVPAPSVTVAARMIADRQLDAFATNKAILFEMADGLTGAKILDGRWGVEHMAVAVPKGREQAHAHLRAFVEEVQKNGFLARAIEQSGLRGTVLP